MPNDDLPAADEKAPLAGNAALIVEDEALIAFMEEDMLTELGAAEVRQAASVPAALEALEAWTPSVALLDVNLAGIPVYPVAERLEALGTRFVFTSGYGQGGIEGRWANAPVLQKPFDSFALE